MCWKGVNANIAGCCQQTFEYKKFVDITQKCLDFLTQLNFPANNLNFHQRCWDWIQAIFLNLFYFKEIYLVSLLLFMCRTLKRLFRAKIRPWISLTSLWEILSHKSRFMLEKKWGCNLLMLLWDKSKYSNWFWSLNVSWRRNRKKIEYLHQIRSSVKYALRSYTISS